MPPPPRSVHTPEPGVKGKCLRVFVFGGLLSRGPKALAAQPASRSPPAARAEPRRTGGGITSPRPPSPQGSSRCAHNPPRVSVLCRVPRGRHRGLSLLVGAGRTCPLSRSTHAGRSCRGRLAARTERADTSLSGLIPGVRASPSPIPGASCPHPPPPPPPALRV